MQKGWKSAIEFTIREIACIPQIHENASTCFSAIFNGAIAIVGGELDIFAGDDAKISLKKSKDSALAN